MRISDWSSDVCSSDLSPIPNPQSPQRRAERDADAEGMARQPAPRAARCLVRRCDRAGGDGAGGGDRQPGAVAVGGAASGADRGLRSEEHTSELQSLMRISYAGLCLKKKKE